MKIYKIKTKCVFEGEFTIQAHSKEEACRTYNLSCSMGVLRGAIGESDNVLAFDVPIHPSDSNITSITVKP